MKLDGKFTAQPLHSDFAILVLSSALARGGDDAGRDEFNLNASLDLVTVLPAWSAGSGKSKLTLGKQLLFAPAGWMGLAYSLVMIYW